MVVIETRTHFWKSEMVSYCEAGTAQGQRAWQPAGDGISNGFLATCILSQMSLVQSPAAQACGESPEMLMLPANLPCLLAACLLAIRSAPGLPAIDTRR